MSEAMPLLCAERAGDPGQQLCPDTDMGWLHGLCNMVMNNLSSEIVVACTVPT